MIIPVIYKECLCNNFGNYLYLPKKCNIIYFCNGNTFDLNYSKKNFKIPLNTCGCKKYILESFKNVSCHELSISSSNGDYVNLYSNLPHSINILCLNNINPEKIKKIISTMINRIENKSAEPILNLEFYQCNDCPINMEQLKKLGAEYCGYFDCPQLSSILSSTDKIKISRLKYCPFR